MIAAQDLQGHWQRDWIKAPGFEDHTTRVHWLQAGDLFADIRVPKLRPDLSGCACLADASPADLEALSLAEGFAGTITVEDGDCTWHREMNWQGPPKAADIGRMSFDAEGRLIEDGVLADYRELWVKRPTPPLRGHRLTCGDQSAILIENAEVFLLALGALEADLPFGSTYCLGQWEGESGVADLSTNPFCEGQTVLTRGGTFTWHGPVFDGSRVPQTLHFKG